MINTFTKMQSPYIFTFIIPYKHSYNRFNNLKRTLDWVNSFSGVELILVEQDTHSKIKHLDLRCKHIFIKSNNLFNKSWAFNVGLRHSTSNIIVFGDADIIMNPNDFISGISALKEYDMVSPYNSVLDLTPQESMLSLEELLKINRPGRGETDHQKINIGGGITIFKRDTIFKIGGWDERFLGWGGEDDFQALKIMKFLKWTELKAKCYHLYHDRVTPDMIQYQKTLQMLQQSSKLSDDDLVKYINVSINKIGMKNKYDNFIK
jgi:predicted glycosyltransferase involved in capsule biosynthesis